MRELTDETLFEGGLGFAPSQHERGSQWQCSSCYSKPTAATCRSGRGQWTVWHASEFTNVALLRDEQTVCMVLEGWAFDPVGSASEVVSTISVGMRSGRALQPVMQIAVEGSSAIG
jgi:hypothetical protein